MEGSMVRMEADREGNQGCVRRDWRNAENYNSAIVTVVSLPQSNIIQIYI